MKHSLFFLLSLLHFMAGAQSLANENLNHLYDPTDEIGFQWAMVKQNGEMAIHYSLTATKGPSPGRYLMQWEERNSYSQRAGEGIRSDSIMLSTGVAKTGMFSVALKDGPWLLVLKITNLATAKTWSYPFLIEKNYPVNGYLMDEGQQVLAPYVETQKEYVLQGPPAASHLFVFRYAQPFGSAYPPFSKNATGQDPLMLPDSTFTVPNGQHLSFAKEGLYLVQSDTSSAEGFSFRVSGPSYPRYTRIQDLAGPLVYLTTKDEFAQLQQSKGDKVDFDKTIIGITRDRDRAKRLIKNYYGRVELANKYFTSYKEGWKTDQGMAFIVFGLPDEIRKTSQNEIWYYKDSRTKFVFIKKGSIYAPHYYTLMRDGRFTQLWYNAIDLWRKARF